MEPTRYPRSSITALLHLDSVMMVATHTADLMGAKNAGLKTAYIHVEEEWIDVFPTPEPVHSLSEFDVNASSWGELVEKLT